MPRRIGTSFAANACCCWPPAGVLAVFVRDGELSYTGTGLLMLLFVLFILMSIAFQHNFTYGETIEAVSTSDAVPSPHLATKEYGYRPTRWHSRS